MRFHFSLRWCSTSLLLVMLGANVLPAVDFSIEPKAGVAWGRAREIVYPVGYDTDNDYLSELVWDIAPAYLLGIGARITTAKHLEIHLDFQGALPLPSGEMYDYDWLYLNRDDWSHRSISDITIRTGFIVDFGVSGSVWHQDGWRLSLTGGYHLDWWSWKDTLEEILYTSSGGLFYPDPPEDWDPGDPFRNDYRDGDGQAAILYRVAYNVPYVGLQSEYRHSRFSGSARFTIGPVIVVDHDQHLRTGDQWIGIGVGGPWMELSTRFGFRTGSLGEWFLSMNGIWCPEVKGRIDQYDEFGNYLGSVSQAAGFQFQRLSAATGYRFTF